MPKCLNSVPESPPLPWEPQVLFLERPLGRRPVREGPAARLPDRAVRLRAPALALPGWQTPRPERLRAPLRGRKPVRPDQGEPLPECRERRRR